MADEQNITTTVETVNPDAGELNPTNETSTEEKQDAASGKENGEITKLKAELAKLKAATDEATREAANYKRQLRAKQSAEEIAAEEKKAADEATQKEIEELRREVARTKAVKTVMGRLGTGEEESSKIAEYLYGAEDVEAALTEIQRAWSAREKALRLEFGKIPAPGAGAENSAENAAVSMARDFGRAKAETTKQANEALKAYMR